MTRYAYWLMTLLMLLVTSPTPAGTVTYIHTDAQGTPVMESDAQGHITARFEYTPYGVVVTSMGAAPDGVGYTGHVNDPESGLVYMQARYYDPARGGFLSVDPVGPTAGNIFSFNRYAYANNNPIVNMDPDGRESACISMNQSCLPPNSDMVGAAKMAVSMVPVVGDAVNISDAYNDPSFANIAIAVVGIVPEVGTAIADVAKVAKATKVASEVGEGVAVTSRAARRQAMREAGIPTSQQPVSQLSTKAGKQLEYEVPAAGGGTRKMVVTDQTTDRVAGHGPHWEAGAAKVPNRTDPLGRLRVVNDKAKVDYGN